MKDYLSELVWGIVINAGKGPIGYSGSEEVATISKVIRVVIIVNINPYCFTRGGIEFPFR